MLVRVLGPLEVEEGGRRVPVGGRQARRVLARLALDTGRPVSVSALVLAAWADSPPRTARHTIATHVLRLRRAGLAIATVPDGYCLQTPTDGAEFERLIGAGRRAAADEPELAVLLLGQALALWRTRPYPELDDVSEAAIEAARLEELAEGGREELLAAHLTTGPPAELIGPARQLAAEQPYRERRWELLMLALYRTGRQAEALDVYAEARTQLVDDLGLEPGPGLRRMQHAVLAQDPALEPPTGPSAEHGSRAGVPGAATRLIGRSRERRDLEEAWDRARLVTLVGPPGAGKTRLALDTARQAGPAVWYVPLEQIPAEQSVAAAMLDVVAPSSRAVEARRGVLDALAASDGLIVLDGCERRLLEVASEVEVLLPACARVRVLATSRERLGLLDEALVPVGPLLDDDAIDLLVDRARLVDPRFELGPDDREAADRLCALVDRLPLAVELVARHLRLLGVRQVAERVEADLGRWVGAPAGGRAGLWAALDTSVARLGGEERRTLLALAVMVADADIALVTRVAGDRAGERAVFDTVARLVDASLVQVRSAAGATRYELLRTVIVHTLQTADATLVNNAQHRYRDAVLDRARELAERLVSADRSATLRLLDREMPHVRAILGEVCAPPVDRVVATRALDTAVTLSDYWLGRHPAEGLEWLGRLIDAAGPPPRLQAEAQLRRSHLAYWLTEFAAGASIAEEARTLFAALGHPLGEGRALRRLGAIAAATDDVVAARSHLEASLARLNEAGVESETGTTLLHLGSLLADEGIVDAALPALQRALAIATAGGDPLARGHALAALTLAYWKAADLERAMHTGGEALNLFRDLGHRPTEGTVAYRLAAIARGLSRPRASRRYAMVAMEAGEQSSTRTTVALAHINLARLDLDAQEWADAADHLRQALEPIDPDADRWVLVEGLEAVARLLVAIGRRGAGPILDCSAAIRSDIHQPVAPTEAGEVEATRANSRHASDDIGRSHYDTAVDVASVHARAVDLAGEIAGSLLPLQSGRRASE